MSKFSCSFAQYAKLTRAEVLRHFTGMLGWQHSVRFLPSQLTNHGHTLIKCYQHNGCSCAVRRPEMFIEFEHVMDSQ